MAINHASMPNEYANFNTNALDTISFPLEDGGTVVMCCRFLKPLYSPKNVSYRHCAVAVPELIF